jgi:hypothetical protein
MLSIPLIIGLLIAEHSRRLIYGRLLLVACHFDRLLATTSITFLHNKILV